MPRAILLACLAFAAPAAAQDTARVAVAFTMGVRGQATGWDYAADEPAWGGLTRAATVLDSLRRAHPDHLVVADGGDLLTGSTFAAWLARNPRTPHPLVEALNLAGYDVATPGPRDAALGAERMGAAYAEARFPVVSASLVRAGGDGPALRPWAVIRRGPLRIAVTGIVTGTVSATGSLRARSLDEALPTLQAMRGEADAVVVFAHLAPGDRARLAELGALADLVVTADMRGPNGVWVADLDAVRAQGRWTVRAGAPRLLVLGLTPEQPRLLAGLADVHAEARAGLAKPLGRAGDTFSARMARAEPVPLVELLHRVQRRHTGATLSLVPIASVDVALPLGDLRRRDLVALDPRQSPVRAVRVTGEQLKDVLETSARYYRLDAQRRPAVAP
ncbi:MAG TPA: 5'-nucleotidase C-terminal domain-containing protein, partial [Gemmatimonadales bacterium]|nr:5'-nucleotidase C-terminal domain-containing protein [Gemmatimonadales bacterium]